MSALPPGWDPKAIPAPEGTPMRRYQDTHAAYMDAARRSRELPSLRAARSVLLGALVAYGQALAAAEFEVDLEAKAMAHAVANDDYFEIPVEDRWYSKGKK